MYAADAADAEVMEKAMADAETIFRKIVNQTVTTRSLPTGDEWIELLGFVATMVVRVPKYRERFRRLADAGAIEPADQRNSYLHVMAQNAEDLVPVLNDRTWMLRTCAEDAPDLVCSDHPVAVRPISADDIPPRGRPNMVLTMPLDRRTLLVGVKEGRAASFALDAASVAASNTATIIYANQVYSSTSDFIWTREDCRVCNAQDLLDGPKADSGRE